MSSSNTSLGESNIKIGFSSLSNTIKLLKCSAVNYIVIFVPLFLDFSNGARGGNECQSLSLALRGLSTESTDCYSLKGHFSYSIYYLWLNHVHHSLEPP